MFEIKTNKRRGVRVTKRKCSSRKIQEKIAANFTVNIYFMHIYFLTIIILRNLKFPNKIFYKIYFFLV